MKNLQKYLMVAACMFGIATMNTACSSDNEPVVAEKTTHSLTFNLPYDDATTRTTIQNVDGVWKHEWSDGDQIRVNYEVEGIKKAEIFTRVPGTDAFTNPASEHPTEGYISLKIVYFPGITETSTTFSIVEQDGTLESLAKYDGKSWGGHIYNGAFEVYKSQEGTSIIKIPKDLVLNSTLSGTGTLGFSGSDVSCVLWADSGGGRSTYFDKEFITVPVTLQNGQLEKDTYIVFFYMSYEDSNIKFQLKLGEDTYEMAFEKALANHTVFTLTQATIDNAGGFEKK